MKYDYHIHAEYSYDSKIKAIDVIDKAILLDYNAIAVTEHLDILPIELSRYGLPPFYKYIDSINNLKKQYTASRIDIICGAEIGDYHRYSNFTTDLVSQLEFDLILGAVHFLSDYTNVAVPMKQPLTKPQVQDYYLQNLHMVQTCDVQVLAHLGVFKRYYIEKPQEEHCQSILKDIFQAMVARDIALEINYSPLRKPYSRLIPEPEQIEFYRSMGGVLFSIGSDSHLLEHFDLHYPNLPNWITENPPLLKKKTKSNTLS